MVLARESRERTGIRDQGRRIGESQRRSRPFLATSSRSHSTVSMIRSAASAILRPARDLSISSCHRGFGTPASAGALAGGFTREALQQWAANEWSPRNTRGKRRRVVSNQEADFDSNLPYADQFLRQVSPECSRWLEVQPYPSSQLGRSLFASRRFAPERLLLGAYASVFCKRPSKSVPTRFDVGDSFIVWTVAAKSPLELILTWEFPPKWGAEDLSDDNGNGKAWQVRGCTQLSFDPKIRRIYMGNAFDGMSKVVESAMVPAHQKYTIFLLEGLVEDLEMSAQESVHNN